MTTSTTLVVIVRLAFFPETGIDAYLLIATVISGRLVTPTLLTLLVVPVVYSLVDAAAEFCKRSRRQKKLNCFDYCKVGKQKDLD